LNRMDPETSKLANLLELNPAGTGSLLRRTASREARQVKQTLEAMADIVDAVNHEDSRALSDSLERAFDGMAANSIAMTANPDSAATFYLAAMVASYVDKMEGMMSFLSADNTLSSAVSIDPDSSVRDVKPRVRGGRVIKQEAADYNDDVMHRQRDVDNSIIEPRDGREEEIEYKPEVTRREIKRSMARIESEELAPKKVFRSIACHELACDFTAKDKELMAAHLESFHADGVLAHMENDGAFNFKGDNAVCPYCSAHLADVGGGLSTLKQHFDQCESRANQVKAIVMCHDHLVNFASTFDFYAHAKEENCRGGVFSAE
ncbi:hypothetical protein PFISCL1PPCAC_3995, partial [Pristionchus fissidentatus]